MESFYLGACQKCGGDILDRGIEEPYCIQCSERIYKGVEPLKDTKVRTRQVVNLEEAFLDRQEGLLSSHKEAVKLLLEGNSLAFVSDFLNLSLKIVIRVKEVLKDTGRL